MVNVATSISVALPTLKASKIIRSLSCVLFLSNVKVLRNITDSSLIPLFREYY